MRPTLIVTLVGGLIGAILLLHTPGGVFDRVLSWLLLLATIAIAAGPRLDPVLRARFQVDLPAVIVIQLGCSKAPTSKRSTRPARCSSPRPTRSPSSASLSPAGFGGPRRCWWALLVGAGAVCGG